MFLVVDLIYRIAQMNWNQHMDAHYIGNNAPYNSAGSFMDFFAGLTYDHVNFIFSGSQMQVQTQISYLCVFFDM